MYGALRGTLQGHQLPLGIGYGGNALQSTVTGGRGTREAEGPAAHGGCAGNGLGSSVLEREAGAGSWKEAERQTGQA